MKRRPRTHGFTLIELLVAITAGMFVAISAFALARQGSKFFQQEARIANAQFAATLGFDRLRADIARAGFLTTANIQRDPFFCGATTAAEISSLAAIRIESATPVNVQDATNGLAPDRITLTGSYTSTETFPVRTVVAENGGFSVYLQANTGAIVRSNNDGTDGGTLGQIFLAGRVLRILDATGHYEFGVISGYSVNGAGQMVIALTPTPDMPFKRSGSCGVEGFGVGMQANIVNRVRYGIRDLRSANLAQYKALYAASATGPGDQTRLDLVRVELDQAGNEIASTLELVAEYAVDLKFGLTVVPSMKTSVDPTLQVYALGDSRNYDYTYQVANANKANDKGPQDIRSVRARLVVRSREADRADTLGAPAGNIFRYAVPDAGFARARTLTADIELPNLGGLSWR